MRYNFTMQKHVSGVNYVRGYKCNLLHHYSMHNNCLNRKQNRVCKVQSKKI